MPHRSRRTRIAAGVAALALIGLSIFGMVEAASAEQPLPPSITTPSQTVPTGTARLATIDGTWARDDASTVTVSDAAGTVCVAVLDQLDENWSCTPTADLIYGVNTLTATSSNGETSDPSDPVDIVRTPPTPTIDTPAGSGTTNPSFTLTGAIDNPYGQHFTVAISDTVNGTTDPDWCHADVNGTTTWTCNDTLNGFGVHSFTARAWVVGDDTHVGASSGSVQQTFGDTSPATTINSIPESANQRPTFSGTGPAMGTVFVENGSPVCATNAVPIDASGNWSCSADHDLGSGTFFVQAHSRYADGTAGDTGTTTFTIDIGPPAVSYSFGPSSIAATVTAGDYANANTQLYQVTPDGEGGYSFGGAAAGCPSTSPSLYTSPTVSCSFGSLPAGIWRVSSGQQQLETMNESVRQNDFVRIPETPTFAARLNTDHTVTMSGRGTAGDLITVSAAANATICTATVTASGAWSCTVTPTQGTYTYQAIATSQGFVASANNTAVDRSYQGLSAFTSIVRVVVPAPTVPIVYTVDFTTSVTSVTPGDTVTFTGTGPPGATVEGEIHSTPVLLGSTIIGPDGTFTLTALIPSDIEPGAHQFVITVTEPGQSPVVVAKPVTVMPAATTGKQTPTDPDHSGLLDTPHRGAAAAINRNAPGAPNALTNSLPTLQTLIRNPIVIGVAAVGGIALLLFVAFPAELLNSTLSENYDRMFGRVRKIKLPWFERVKAFLARTPTTGGLLITAIAAIIFGFADPHFGFDLSSLRLVLACGIALFIVGYVANALTARIVRKRWAIGTVMELKPLGLILTIVGVLISRLIDFSPGFLIGLILGMSLVGTSTVKQRSRAILLRSGIMLAFSLIAWLLLSLLQSGGEPESFLPALTNDTLAGVVTEGLTALVVGLLPFRFLDGESLFAESWKIWAGSYAVALIAFCVMVLPSDEHWKNIGASFVVWISVVVGFAIVTLGLYLFFRTRYRESKAEGESADQKEEISAAP